MNTRDNGQATREITGKRDNGQATREITGKALDQQNRTKQTRTE